MGGGGRLGKGSGVNTGDLLGQEVATPPTGVRATIVAKNSGNAEGAKGGREVESSRDTPREENSPLVSVKDKQGEEDLWQRHKSLKFGLSLDKINNPQNNLHFSLDVCLVVGLDMVWDFQLKFN